MRTTTGYRLQVSEFLGSGGEGITYAARNLDTGESGVLKDFHAQFRKKDTIRRLEFLIQQQFDRRCSVLVKPTEIVVDSGVVGHYARRVKGSSLESFFASGNLSFMESLVTATACVHGIGVMHDADIIHGDIRDENVLLHRVGSVIQAHIIDMDNFAAPGEPPPHCVGQMLYLAPELRAALKSGRAAVPDIHSERYSLGVLLHEIVLLKHPACGRDGSEEEFNEAMSGDWLHDPASSEILGLTGGLPVSVLNSTISSLFRRSLRKDRFERPAAQEWETELLRATGGVVICPFCNARWLVDSSKKACPLCDRPFEAFRLITLAGRSIDLAGGCVRVGRDDLGGSAQVSALHAVFRQVGPEAWVESVGRNGTFRNAGNRWIRLPDQKAIAIRQGDRLRMADVEVRIE